MIQVRRFLDIRPGEGLPVLLTFLHISVVVAAFLLAKPIRTGLFLEEHDADELVYAYAAVPLVLSIFVPMYTRVVARFGTRTVAVGTLLFFSSNVLLFWYGFRYYRSPWLPGIFYVWVNCFGVIAPVQAWTFANSLFDTRQAKRLFGLIGSGASLGAIAGGVIARFLVGAVGGTVNLLLVLAALIALAAGIVMIAKLRIRRVGLVRRSRPVSQGFPATWKEIGSSPYLRLIAGLVFAVAIATQWTAFQLSLEADRRFEGNAELLTQFYGTFSFVTGIISFVLQLLVTGRVLRSWGLAATILALPLALGSGNLVILLLPGFWTVLMTNGFDQGLRFSLDKASYELLYLPIAPARRLSIKNAIDIVVNRVADGVGAVALGLITGGFLMLPGLGLGTRGIAGVNVVALTLWLVLAWRLRAEYVRTIRDSIHRHRIDSERDAGAGGERTAAEALRAKLTASNPSEVRYALDLIEGQRTGRLHTSLRPLLSHPEPDIRRRALAILSADGDDEIAERVPGMLSDPDIGVRTEALLYLSRESGIDPLRQSRELGEFEGFSIRAAYAAFVGAPGKAQNLDAAALMLESMATSPGAEGERDRVEAARLIGSINGDLVHLLPPLITDESLDVARQAVRSAQKIEREELIPPLIVALGRAELAEDAADALARLGDAVVPHVAGALHDETLSVEVRRGLPAVLFRIGTVEAEQALVGNLLLADGTVRHRVIQSLNRLRVSRPDVPLDTSVLELLLAAEIAGHYRSYQMLGPLRAQLKEDDPVLEGLSHSMDQELERIFRLMNLLFPYTGVHDAYVGLRSSDPAVRANALELLDNVLKPELRHLLVPLLDQQVSLEERIERGNRLVGAPLQTVQQAVATMIASDDPWLRSCGVHAVGTLQLNDFAQELERLEESGDPLLKRAVVEARARLAADSRALLEQQHPAPPDLDAGVGAG